MSLQRRILVMLVMVGMIFCFMIFLYLKIEQERLLVIHEAQRSVHEDVLDKVLDLKGESLQTLVSDYTYWDEMVSYVQTHDATWAKNILETSLPTYKADGLWVYDLNKQLIYSVGKTDSFSVAGDIFPGLFERSPFCHFFIQSPQGLWEIRGATIHASDDQERVGASYGYFFAGRLWNANVLDDLSSLENADIHWDRQGAAPIDPIRNIEISRTLPGWNGKPVKILKAVFNSPTISNTIKVSNQILQLLVFGCLMAGLFVWGFLLHWVSRPLRLISTTLKEGNTMPLETLQKDRTEMGDIARLIKQFFEQKQALVDEINERKRVEKDLWETQTQLFHAENMSSIGRMAAGVSNEINSPVGYIITNIDVLEIYFKALLELFQDFEQLELSAAKIDDPMLQGQLKQLKEKKEKLNLDFIRKDLPHLIDESLQGAQRIKEIVVLLSSYSHREAQEKKHHDVNKILETCLRLSHNEMQDRIKINKQYGDVPSILCNQQEIIQVFLNILLNAVQAIEKKGEITIKSFADDVKVTVQISDSGSGIPAEHRNKIFEPFFTTKTTGTGLGLSLAGNIIQKHKGTIRVNSEDDRGTTFTIELPIG